MTLNNCGFDDLYCKIGGHSVHAMFAGKGENVVFLHGWGADASAFLFVANSLKSNFRVILIDFAGFGKSDPPEVAYGVKDYASDALKVLNELSVDSATLVGHSFGGRVAIEIAAQMPNLVKRLALVDSAGLAPRRGPRYYFRIFLHKTLRRLGFKGLKGSADYRALSDNMKETFKKVVSYDQTSLLCNILCPTAIFWGKADRVTPPYMARKFKKKIADSALFMLRGGHFAYAEDSDTFMRVLTAFLKA